jgi:hypothetical protein
MVSAQETVNKKKPKTLSPDVKGVFENIVQTMFFKF